MCIDSIKDNFLVWFIRYCVFKHVMTSCETFPPFYYSCTQTMPLQLTLRKTLYRPNKRPHKHYNNSLCHRHNTPTLHTLKSHVSSHMLIQLAISCVFMH